MLSKFDFKKSRNSLEGVSTQSQDPHVPDSMCIPCKSCGNLVFSQDLKEIYHVCPQCGHHFRLAARERVELTFDEGSFTEWDSGLRSVDVLDFPGYSTKLRNTRLQSREKDAVITGRVSLSGIPLAVFSMDSKFMMGSMGSVVGEKITRLFERATEERLPVIGFTVSGGARMQEGIYSLMQMAKVSGAVKYHSDAGLLYITVLTDPTTGGVTASFAMEGDILLAEPGALIGFAGPRVIEQTIRQKLPKGFQSAEFLLEKGFLDAVVSRKDLKGTLENLLKLHSTEGEPDGRL